MIPFSGKPVRAAKGFRGFIERVCLGKDAAKILGDPAWMPERTFTPFGCAKGTRKKPRK